MAWSTPKIDWHASYDGTTYTGDYFSYVDMNRIRDNLEYLTSLATQLYTTKWSIGLPETKGVNNKPYAYQINALEARLHEMNSQTVNVPIGKQQTFFDNGKFPDATELNRIESAILLLREHLLEQANGRKVLAFTLGLEGPFRE